jgi:hypothetical protein
VTTREKVDEIKQHYGKTAIDHALEFLSPVAGAALLHYAGAVRAGEKTIARDDKELQQASVEVHGHALTLFLIGQYLSLTEDGDIRRRDRMKLADAEAEYKNDATRKYGHAFKAIEAYEKWFEAGDEQAKRQLAILRLLGLFDRPASNGCLTALRAQPPIAGLNAALTGGSDKDWKIALGRLQGINLVSIKDDDSVDCHPLIREYFGAQLKANNPEAWQAGHKRLYEYLCETTKEGDQPTLEDLQPLYQAVAHGCQAGLQQEARAKIYCDRVLRGTGSDGFYSWKKLGAFGSNLGALASFFEQQWNRVSPALTQTEQAWLLSETATQLRALGRLMEAVEPMRVGLKMAQEAAEAAMDEQICLHQFNEAARRASNLSDLELTLGEVTRAVGDAKQSVTYADRSGDASMQMIMRTTHADAQHQAGRRAEAETSFREAEQMQTDRQPDYPLLYSVQGFQYCDLLLATLERATWQMMLELKTQKLELETSIESCRAVSGRAAQTLKIAEEYFGRGLGPLDIALDHLTLGRAALYEVLLASEDLPFKAQNSELKASIDAAAGGLRQANRSDYLPRGLLTRAWLRFLTGARTGPGSAQEDLDEAWEISERGPMKLFMADVHLYRARLFHAVKPYPWATDVEGNVRGPKDDLAAARKLIEECGYGRRKEELEDAEEAAKNW